ncbi:MAG TPA: recombinase family protein [Thermomicrobiales bacterium]|nr:recombinase family protein [Thermomicrobiales bacterium]
MQTATIAASYERVSRRTQGQHGYSLAFQRQSVEEFASAQGWSLPEHLRFRDGEEENASGVDWDLPGLTAMLDAARRKEFGVLVTPDLDRFARSLVKGLVLEEQLRKYGVRVVYQRVPVDDTPEGRLLKNQLFGIAEYEREKTLLRTMNGRRQKAREGKVVGAGPAPYGYRYVKNERGKNVGLEPDPETAPIALRILNALLTRSAIDVCLMLNDEGIPGPTGGPWRMRVVNRIGQSPVYMGVWIYGKHGRRVGPDSDVGIRVPVPAIITRAHHDALQDAMAHRTVARRGRKPPSEDPYVLRGMMHCGRCGGLLRVIPNGTTRYYGCLRHLPSVTVRHGMPQCDLQDVYALDLEAALWDAVSNALLDAEQLKVGLQAARERHDEADRLRHDRLAALDAVIARDRKRLDALTLQLLDADPERRRGILRANTTRD